MSDRSNAQSARRADEMSKQYRLQAEKANADEAARLGRLAQEQENLAQGYRDNMGPGWFNPNR